MGYCPFKANTYFETAYYVWKKPEEFFREGCQGPTGLRETSRETPNYAKTSPGGRLVPNQFH